MQAAEGEELPVHRLPAFEGLTAEECAVVEALLLRRRYQAGEGVIKEGNQDRSLFLIAKGTAANSIMLLGILPIYVALVLGGVVLAAPEAELQWMIKIGLMLPFIAGLWGLRAIYEGIMDLHDAGGQAECSKRRCFLRRLTLSWAAVYTAVLPIMIYRLWEFIARGMTI